jgi:hypothetical protein
MVAKKTPQELLGLSLNVAGVALIIVGLFMLALSIVWSFVGRELPLGPPLTELVVSLFLIAVGIVFTAVGFYSQQVGKGKR